MKEIVWAVIFLINSFVNPYRVNVVNVADEFKQIPILEYHHIGSKTGLYSRSPAQLKSDLLWLYNNGYVSLSLEDFINNNFPIPAGKKPVIFTFDDGLISQFRYLDDGLIDPDCAVGIMDSFFGEHPDFGRAATFFVNDNPFGQSQKIKKKFEYLQKTGRHIGFHTLKHTNLLGFSSEKVEKILLEQANALAKFLPQGMILTSLAYPFGGVPKEDLTTIKEFKTGQIKAAMLVGAQPALPLYVPGANPFRIPRIQAIDNEFLRHFGRTPGSVSAGKVAEKFTPFVSDGNTEKFTFLSKDKTNVMKSLFLKEKEINFVSKNNSRARVDSAKINNIKLNFIQIDRDLPRKFLLQTLRKFRKKPPAIVRGIYLTAYTAGSPNAEFLLDKLKKNGGTAVVVDFKETDGNLYYPTSIELNKKLGGNNRILFNDPKKFIEKAHQKELYVIARIVCFKDLLMVSKKPEWAIKDSRGNAWKTAEVKDWLDPSLPAVQDYILSIAKEAVRFGADEIQFDYVRFPTKGTTKFTSYNFNPGSKAKFEVIRDFLKKAHETIELSMTYIGIDVFGIIAWNREGDVISTGQKIDELAPYVDVIYPMVYPSHYGPGFGGHKNPADEPYFFVKNNTRLFQELIDGYEVVLRPWLQGFTYRVSHFGPNYIKQQINAARDLGIDSFMIWNAANNYDAAWSAFESL